MTLLPRATAIITTFRRPDVLPRAIHSALGQSVSDVEVVVVDDEPSQAVREIVESIADPRLRYLPHERNKGLSAARNTGIRAASSPVVAFLDDDDEWAPDKLAKQLTALEAAGGSVVVTSLELWKRPDRSLVRDIRLNGNVFPALLGTDMVHMQTLLVPIAAFEVVGGFDETLFHHEDLDMALRLARQFSFVTVPEPLTVIHVTPDSLSTNTRNRIEALERIIDKTPEIRGRRRVRSRWLYRLARLHGEAGDARAWRRALVAALRADPLNPRAVSMFFTSLLGGPTLHIRLARLRGRVARRVRQRRNRPETDRS